VSQEITAGQIKKWNAKTIWPKESGIPVPLHRQLITVMTAS
jgi:hypothetical protein